MEVKPTFFVAKDGNDTWSGKLAKADKEKSDGPFATLVGARDAIRKLKAKDAPKEPLFLITDLSPIQLLFLTNTLRFDFSLSIKRDNIYNVSLIIFPIRID